jgi:hypothetical protein
MIDTLDIVIEKNVPIPPKRRATGPRGTKYRFGDMDIGDSFALPLGGEVRNGNYLSTLRLTNAAASYKARTPGFTFCIRTLPDEEEVRIWRMT